MEIPAWLWTFLALSLAGWIAWPLIVATLAVMLHRRVAALEGRMNESAADRAALRELIGELRAVLHDQTLADQIAARLLARQEGRGDVTVNAPGVGFGNQTTVHGPVTGRDHTQGD